MNILEVSQILGVSITIGTTVSDDVERKWHASLEGVDIKEGCLLGSATAFGSTPDEALINLCTVVSGSTVVLHRDGSRLTSKIPNVVRP